MPNWLKQREELVRKHIAPVVNNPRVVEAFAKVPREAFVPPKQRAYAYWDTPLPIGEGQTISQPSLIAQMTQAINPQPKSKVLEVGTGSGYQAAILAEIVGRVFSIERIRALAERARLVLDRLGYRNVQIKVGDGSQGWPEHAPYDAIIVTAAAPKVPRPLVRQLKENGRLIIPVGSEVLQEIWLGVKENGQLHVRPTVPVRFVPLIGKHGWR